MSTSDPRPGERIVGVRVDEHSVSADLADGRTITVPLAWFPRLLHATPDERGNWQLIARGQGIHWPDLDEDISVASIIAGRPSTESAASLQKWLNERKA